MKRGLKAHDLSRFNISVTTVTPMKRGLKARLRSLETGCDSLVSYNRYPDEKGTESLVQKLDLAVEREGTRYNRYPDEKGTESLLCAVQICRGIVPVTTVTPMKRGLKGNLINHPFLSFRGYNRYPDEKGTESNGSAVDRLGR